MAGIVTLQEYGNARAKMPGGRLRATETFTHTRNPSLVQTNQTVLLGIQGNTLSSYQTLTLFYHGIIVGPSLYTLLSIFPPHSTKTTPTHSPTTSLSYSSNNFHECLSTATYSLHSVPTQALSTDSTAAVQTSILRLYSYHPRNWD